MKVFFITALVLMNGLLLAINVVPDAPAFDEAINLVEPDIPSLSLISEIDPAINQKAHIAGSCFTVGPFSKVNNVDSVLNRIQDFGLPATQRQNETLESQQFLVYIPSQHNKAQAQQVVEELTRFGVKEHYVIEAQENRNAISLGRFDDSIKADRHKEFVRYLGYDARVHAQSVKRSIYWVDYGEPRGTNAPVVLWGKEASGNQNILRIERPC